MEEAGKAGPVDSAGPCLPLSISKPLVLWFAELTSIPLTSYPVFFRLRECVSGSPDAAHRKSTIMATWR
jgi:hypothetical protein